MSGTFTLPNTLTPGVSEDVRDVQSNFEAVRDRINNGLVDQPVPAAAAKVTDNLIAGGPSSPLLGTEEYDTGGLHAVNDSDLVVVLAGLYVVTASLYCPSGAVGGARNDMRVVCLQMRAAVEISRATASTECSVAGNPWGVTATLLCKAEVGDEFKLEAYNHSTQTQLATVHRLAACWQSTAT